MSIDINGKPFEVLDYDNKNTLFQRYSVKKENTIPSYLSMVEKDIEISPGESITILDIRDELDKINLEEFSKKEYIEKLLNEYPLLSQKEIVVLFLFEKYKTILYNESLKSIISQNINIIKNIDPKTFFSVNEIIKLLKNYNSEFKVKFDQIKNDLEQHQNIIDFSKNVKSVDYKSIQLEEVTSLYKIELLPGSSLEDVFDAIKVSRDIPFVHLSIGNKNWYKVFQHLSPIDSWVQEKQNDGLYFKIINVEYSKLNSKRDYENFYSNGVWKQDNSVYITQNIKKSLKVEEIKKKFFSSFGNRLNYNILNEKQDGVKGKFSIENIYFNKAVFADMVNLSSIFSYFLFFDEHMQKVSGKYKSAITKDRFLFYYEPDQNGEKNSSFSITLTPYLPDTLHEKEWIDVRVSRAKNKKEIKKFQSVFTKLLTLYNENHDSVIKEYEVLLPSSVKLFANYVKTPKIISDKIDKKSKKRVLNLKKQRKYVFRSGYASICQPASHQPYILNEEEATEFKKKHDPHKIMEFVDPSTGNKDWYACEPREVGEPGTHIFPGLRENTSRDKKYVNEIPYFPCCYSEDQYTKPASELKRRLEKSLYGENEFQEEITENPRHFFAPNKLVTPDRFGQLPFYLNSVAKNAGYKIKKFGKIKSYPIFRYGVLESPDSFLHCLEKAFNPRYSSSNKERKIEIVSYAREELSKLDYSVARQELYDFSDELIKDILLEKTHYLDPSIWIRLAETKYNCNIFIYQVTDEHPNGEIVIPRYSQAYLFKEISEDKPSVFIIKKTIQGDFPFQCELLVKYKNNSDNGQNIFYYFEEDSFVKESIKILYNSNNVSIVRPKELLFYAPVSLSEKIFQDIKSQYIDQNGKTRMLNYNNGVSLMVSPIPPLNIPLETKIEESDLEEAMLFIKEKDLIILEQDGNELDNIIQGIWVEPNDFKNSGIHYGYIPLKVTEGLRGVKYSSIYKNDPLRTDEESELKEMNHFRKIAEFLKQYTLFQYSLDSENFGKDSYVVIPNHNYRIDLLDKKLIHKTPIMYKNNKLIVPSEETVDRLINFLKVNILNDKPGVMSYAERKVLKGYYEKLNDFLNFPQQLIFLDKKSLDRWKTESKYNIYRKKVFSCTHPDQSEPYFYKNSNIEDGKVVLIQNVRDGNLERALSVSRKWKHDNVNPGYDHEGFYNDLNYKIYTEEGDYDYIKDLKNKINVNILKYKNGGYASILFL